LTETVPAGGDRFLYFWNLWWVHRALFVEHTSPYFTSWIFYPEGVSLLYHTLGVSAFLPFLPVVALGGVPGVILSHNLVILSSFVLCGLATYLLALDETGSRLGALLAGVVFAFCAHRLAKLGWTSLLSAQYLVFYVFFLLRAIRGGRLNAVAAAFFLALVWYNSFTHVAFALLLTLGIVIWQGPLRRRVLATTIAIAAGTAVLIAPLLWDFYETRFVEELEWTEPTEQQIDRGGTDPRFFFVPRDTRSAFNPLISKVFPDTFQAVQASVEGWGASPFVPASLGYSLLVLVAIAVFGGRERRRWAWLAFGVGALALSLGPHLRLGDRLYEGLPLPYALLRDLPGIAMSKAHYRFVPLGVLCLGVFAAFGVAAVTRPREGESGRSRRLRSGLAALLVAAVFGEYGSAAPPIVPVQAPRFARTLSEDPGDYAVLHYPRIRGIAWLEEDMWGQVSHEKRLLTGYVARIPRNPAVSKDPAYSFVATRLQRIDVPSQLEQMDRLFREPRYRVKYLVVSGPRLAKITQDAGPLIDALRERYVQVESGPAWAGPDPRKGWWLFYVGGAAFAEEARHLSRLAEELRASPHGPAAEERLAELRERWQAFRDGAAGRERSTPLFHETEKTVRETLSAAIPPPLPPGRTG